MNILPVLLLFLSVINSLVKSELQSYDYFMFENFPLNGENFKQELKLVPLLHSYLETLATWRDFLADDVKRSKIDKHSPISGIAH